MSFSLSNSGGKFPNTQCSRGKGREAPRERGKGEIFSVEVEIERCRTKVKWDPVQPLERPGQTVSRHPIREGRGVKPREKEEEERFFWLR